MPNASLENLARATGKSAEEVGHLLTCTACTADEQCNENPALIAAAIAAYRGSGAAPDTADRPRRDRHAKADLFGPDKDPRKKS